MKLLFLSIFVFLFSTLRSQSLKEVNDSLLYYYQGMQFEKATPFAEKAIVLIKEKYGTENAIYAKYLYLISGLYISSFEFEKAEKIFLEMNEINKNLSGINSKEYIDGISALAVIYNTKGENSKAAPLFAEALEYYRIHDGDTSATYATAANRLAKVYEGLGEYDKAIAIFKRSIDILLASKGGNDLSYATSLNNLGIVYKNTGEPEKAEPLMLKAMEIRKRVSGISSEEYANSLNNLAVLYSGLGQHRIAKEYYSKAAAIFKRTKGSESAEYITSLTNLGSEHDLLGEYEKAEAILSEALAIAGKHYNENWPQRLFITKDLGQLYLALEQYDKAEPLLIKVADHEKEMGNKENYAAALNDIAYLFSHTNRLALADSTYTVSAALTKASLGDLHPAYAATLTNLAFLYQKEERYPDAIRLLSEVNRIKEFNLVNLFAILSEEEKTNYMATNIFLQQNNLSLLYNYPEAPASFYRENFNIQLLMKSLLLTDSRNVLTAIRTSKDSAVKASLIRWQKNKTVLAKEYAMPLVQRDPNLKALENETQQLEKELIRVSSGFRNMRDGIAVKMEDIQAKLEEDEAAIEFVSFNLFNKDLTDSIIYAALLLKKHDKAPFFIPLFEEKQLLKLAGKAGNTSKVLINMLYPGTNAKDTVSLSTNLYRLVWQPLESHLNGIKKISYAPAGRLNSVAFHALSPAAGVLITDQYQLDQYTSLRDRIQEIIPVNDRPANAILIGNPEFSSDSIRISKLKKLNPGNEPISTNIYKADHEGFNNGWESLAGTETEIREIKKLFDANRISTKVFTKENASEENLKKLDGHSSQTLFIATHGFFLPARSNTITNTAAYGRNVLANSADPLLRSGLILARGNYAWTGNTPGDAVEDGIVTAYEISQLDLRNTGLVILSACETGLGDIKGAEGVFGLQRAFKLAGVNKMIVSLWKVPDKETAELMTGFYRYWLNGKTIRTAFENARTDMRKKYPPYYWAAFVLIN